MNFNFIFAVFLENCGKCKHFINQPLIQKFNNFFKFTKLDKIKYPLKWKSNPFIDISWMKYLWFNFTEWNCETTPIGFVKWINLKNYINNNENYWRLKVAMFFLFTSTKLIFAFPLLGIFGILPYLCFDDTNLYDWYHLSFHTAVHSSLKMNQNFCSQETRIMSEWTFLSLLFRFPVSSVESFFGVFVRVMFWYIASTSEHGRKCVVNRLLFRTLITKFWNVDQTSEVTR